MTAGCCRQGPPVGQQGFWQAEYVHEKAAVEFCSGRVLVNLVDMRSR